MSKVVEVDEEEFLGDRSVAVMLMSETEFIDDPCCPSCRSTSHAAEIVHTMTIDDHLVSIYLCEDCLGMFMVASFPMLFDTAAPIRLRFTLKEEVDVDVFEKILDTDGTQYAASLFDLDLP